MAACLVCCARVLGCGSVAGLQENTDAPLVEKAAALGLSLIQGHAFADGNKRIGHAALEVF